MSDYSIFAATSLTARDECVRLMIYPGEVLRLSAGRPRVRVVSGTGWITWGPTDHLLRAGERLELPRAHRLILLSALKGSNLVVELSH